MTVSLPYGLDVLFGWIAGRTVSASGPLKIVTGGTGFGSSTFTSTVGAAFGLYTGFGAAYAASMINLKIDKTT